MTEIFATGIQMGESPRWHDGRFWLCDWVAGEVLVFGAVGSREVVARVEGLPFSIDWLPDGRLITTTNAGVVVGPDLTPFGCVRVAEGGQVLGTVEADRGCFSCTLGAEDGRTLYVVANAWSEDGASDGVVLTERVAVPRAGRP